MKTIKCELSKIVRWYFGLNENIELNKEVIKDCVESSDFLLELFIDDDKNIIEVYLDEEESIDFILNNINKKFIFRSAKDDSTYYRAEFGKYLFYSEVDLLELN